MLKICSAAALLAFAGAAFAQATPGTPSSTPGITPSQTPATTPSQTPAVTPSQSPSAFPSPTPPSAIGGLSRCENMIGADRDNCQRNERAAAGSTGIGSTGGTMSTQPAAPAGTTGTVR